MKVLGNDIYIQRGEIWTLDLQVSNTKGDPFMLFSGWRNPYLAITVTAARYEQEGDFRQTYWLDLDKFYAEGESELQTHKRFVGTEALPLKTFSIFEALTTYEGQITLDGGEFDVKNYLFYTADAKGNRAYKYVSDYTFTDGNGNGEAEIDEIIETWTPYDFRIVKSFNTKSWIEQRYLYDIKVLSGQSVKERIAELSLSNDENPNAWGDETTRAEIAKIDNADLQRDMLELYESGVPLMPDYDTRALILEPTNIYVSANIQGGVR